MSRSHSQRMARNHEMSFADLMNGRRQPGSGSQDHSKGDVRTEGADGYVEELCELKATRQHVFRLRYTILEKIRKEAAKKGAHWVLQVRFQRQGGLAYDLAVISLDRWLELEGKDTYAIEDFHSGNTELLADERKSIVLFAHTAQHSPVLYKWYQHQDDWRSRRNEFVVMPLHSYLQLRERRCQ